jgi:hypothetical protein
MITCPNCGAATMPGAFCAVCGSRLHNGVYPHAPPKTRWVWPVAVAVVAILAVVGVGVGVFLAASDGTRHPVDAAAASTPATSMNVVTPATATPSTRTVTERAAPKRKHGHHKPQVRIQTRTVTAPPPVPAPLPPVAPDSGRGIRATFATYFDGINTGDYAAAWSVLSPRHQADVSFQAFADGVSSSYDTGTHILSSRWIDATTVGVVLSFTSSQSPDKGPDGDVCDVWTLDYRLISIGGNWFIDEALPIDGRTHITC